MRAAPQTAASRSLARRGLHGLLAGAALALAPAPLSSQEDAMLRYHVRLPDRHAHRVQLALTIDDVTSESVDVAMPVWTPGSYLVREFARHVVALTAHASDGTPLASRKVDKNTWRIATGGHDTVVVEYVLYANERSVRTNHVDATHAFLSPAGTFLWVDGRTDEPYHVTVETPAGWSVFTGLPAQGEGWTASDYDVLVDSPIEIGPHRRLTFEHEGVPHHIVLAGEATLDEQRLLADVARVVAEVASVFGTMPFDDYTFLIELVDQGGGGLEHANSSVNMWSRWKLVDDKDWRGLLALLAHEYFHAWNVKRFRPAALGPFDYDVETYTTDLWVCEGITSYVDDLTIARAGFHDKITDYLGERAKAFKALHETPGRSRMSLERSSWDAWIKHYRPDENSQNAAVSYYSKGALVALLLDLRIRRLTHGARTLFDAMRLGWERYTARGLGYPDGIMQALCEEVAGADLSGFFDAYVRGTAELDPVEELAAVGLRLTIAPDKSDRPLPEDVDGFLLAPTLGLQTEARDGLCRVKTVLEDGPAFAAGVNVDDRLLAVDAMRVTPDTLQDRLDRTLADGAARPVTLTLYRGESLLVRQVTPALERLASWTIEPVEEATDAQAALFESWLAAPHPSRVEEEDDDAEDADDVQDDGETGDEDNRPAAEADTQAEGPQTEPAGEPATASDDTPGT